MSDNLFIQMGSPSSIILRYFFSGGYSEINMVGDGSKTPTIKGILGKSHFLSSLTNNESLAVCQGLNATWVSMRSDFKKLCDQERVLDFRFPRMRKIMKEINCN